MNYFLSEHAIVEEDVVIGEGSRIWHFAHIMKGARIGVSASIGEHVFIGKGVLIGDNSKIANGTQIYEGVIIKNNVHVGNNVSFQNVKYPRAWRTATEYLATVVEDNVTIKANAVIAAGVHIGPNSTIGEGAIVIRDISEGGFVVSPAATCICERQECKECSERKKKNIIRALRHAQRYQETKS